MQTIRTGAAGAGRSSRAASRSLIMLPIYTRRGVISRVASPPSGLIPLRRNEPMTTLGWLLALSLLQAQEAAKDGPPVPMPSNVLGSATPALLPERRLRFRFKAPDAKIVE